MRRVHGKIGIVLLVAGLVLGVGACKNDQPAEGEGGGAAAQKEAEWTRPGPYSDPESALQALFEALRSKDPREIEATLISLDECLAVTGDETRCQRIAQRRAAFLALFQRTPLPDDAHLVNILLMKSIELDASERDLERSVRIQPGTVRFRTSETGDDTMSIKNVAAIQVKGGWRVLPGQPRLPKKPAAGAETDGSAKEKKSGTTPPSAAAGAPAPGEVPSEPSPPAE